MQGLFHILERKCAQKNAHFWEQKLLLLLIKKYIQVRWTYKKVSFLYSKSFSGIKYSDKNLQKWGCSKHGSHFLRSIRSWNCTLYLKFSRNLKKEPVFGIKLKKLNLQLFRKNYSSYKRLYMFLEYLIPKRMFDVFSIVFQESTFKNSK